MPEPDTEPDPELKCHNTTDSSCPRRGIHRKRKRTLLLVLLLRPLLEYAATVWDPYTAIEIQTLEKVQRRSLEQQDGSPTDTARHHALNTMLDALGRPTFRQEQRGRRGRLEMLYKFHYGLVSVYQLQLPA